MTYSDNPAFTSTLDQRRVDMWEDAYASGQVGSSGDALRAVMRSAGILHQSETDAQSRIFAVLDIDADADIDPPATTATASSGAFGGAGVGTPYNLEALNSIRPRPIPAFGWTAGQGVELGDGSDASWDDTAVTITSGEADTEVFTATAHGLAVGDALIFTALTGGTGLAINTNYSIATVPDANSFTLKAHPAGTAVTFSTDVTAATAYTGVYVAGVVPA